MGLPPGPELPGHRVAQLWIERPVEFWEDCAAKYGDTFTIELGSLGTTVLFADPEAVRHVFQLSPEVYECGPFNGHYNAVMGANSLLVSDGGRHRRMRRMLAPPLHRRLLEAQGEAIVRVVRRSLEGWPMGRAFSPRPMLHLISMEVVLGMLFGSDEDALAREIRRVFAEEIYQDLGSWSAWTRFVRYQPRLRERIAGEVARRRGGGGPEAGGTTLFDALIQGRDESGAPLSDAEIQDHIFTMLVAGVDPTALALAWALYWILGEPEVLGRLRREIDDLGTGPAPALIAELPYLSAACQEALRMYPVVITPTGRKLVAPAEVQGRRYPAGVTLLPCTYLVHRRGELYPDPGRFRPERFLGRQYAPHEYFPFGGGARTCIGAALAPLELKLVLAEILARCELAPAHTGPVRPVRHGTLLAPSDALRFVLAGPRAGPGGTPA
jgi:cytochrome P450